MLEFPRWKYVLILLILAVSVLFALPNKYQKDPSIQITANRGAQLDAALTSKVVAMLDSAHLKPKAIAKEGDNLVVRMASTHPCAPRRTSRSASVRWSGRICWCG